MCFFALRAFTTISYLLEMYKLHLRKKNANSNKKRLYLQCYILRKYYFYFNFRNIVQNKF